MEVLKIWGNRDKDTGEKTHKGGDEIIWVTTQKGRCNYMGDPRHERRDTEERE